MLRKAIKMASLKGRERFKLFIDYVRGGFFKCDLRYDAVKGIKMDEMDEMDEMEWAFSVKSVPVQRQENGYNNEANGGMEV